MSVDVVCYYADLGRPYKPLIERMCASARKVMPEARLVLLTPTPETEVASLFDVPVPLPCKTSFDNLCLERSRAIFSWSLATPTRTIYCDPDIEFRHAPEFDGSFDVGLVWRSKKADQPINTGLILAEPNRPAFWKHYGSIAVNLPREVHFWWCDQLAFALLTGVCHKPNDRLLVDDARVWLMDSRSVCSKPSDATPECWTHHFKGALKGGPEWAALYGEKSSDGSSSPVSR